MRILVIGGTGTVGSQVVARLVQRGEDVAVMTRSAEKAATVPSGVVGDLSDPPSLYGVMREFESVMLITAVHPDEARHGQTGVRAAQRAGVRKIVYLSLPLPPGSADIPHFASKIPIEKAIKESGMSFTILRPNHFFQNDYWLKEAILNYGIYPQPIGTVGVHRVDVGDIADVAVKALIETGLEGKTVGIHGPDLLTGKDMARTWTKYVGSEVNYMGDDLEAWAEQASQTLPAWMVHYFKIMYDYFQKNGLKAETGDHEKLTQILGRPPRSFDSFASETAALWKQAGNAQPM